MNVQELQEYLISSVGCEVLIGEPRNRAYETGPEYICFINGEVVPDGGVAPFVGTDVTDKEVEESLLMWLTNYLFERQATRIYLRMGLEIKRYPARFDCFDHLAKLQYFPARLIARTRIAFEDKSK